MEHIALVNRKGRRTIPAFPEIGKRVKECTQEAGINTAKLAELCEVSRPTVYDWFEGKITLERLHQVANILGESPTFLFSGKAKIDIELLEQIGHAIEEFLGEDDPARAAKKYVIAGLLYEKYAESPNDSVDLGDFKPLLK